MTKRSMPARKSCPPERTVLADIDLDTDGALHLELAEPCVLSAVHTFAPFEGEFYEDVPMGPYPAMDFWEEGRPWLCAKCGLSCTAEARALAVVHAVLTE